MKKIRVLVLATLLALSAAVPVIATFAPAEPSHPAVVRVAEEPTPTPTPNGGNPPVGCGSGGC